MGRHNITGNRLAQESYWHLRGPHTQNSSGIRRVANTRAIGQVVSIYLAIGSCAATAQDNRPGRATFAEMIAYARIAVGACERLTPDADGFHALALMRLIKPPLAEKEIAAKEKDVKRLRDRLGLRKWCQRYAGEMAQARILVEALRRKN
jgi:hypothetical protein